MNEPVNAGEGYGLAKSLDERDYVLGRAEQHRVLAEAASDTETKAIHARFEQLYQERARAIVVDFG